MVHPEQIEMCPNPICDNERMTKVASAVGALVCPNCDLVVMYSPRTVDVYVPPTPEAA